MFDKFYRAREGEGGGVGPRAHDLPRHRRGARRPHLGRGPRRAAARRSASRCPLERRREQPRRCPRRPQREARRDDRVRRRWCSSSRTSRRCASSCASRSSRTTTASSRRRPAAEALQQAAAYTPDAVLLDLGLPDMDGLEVTRRLREWSTVPILVISARGQEDSKVQGARRRRRRLPDQAVRRGRAHGAPARRAAPRRAVARGAEHRRAHRATTCEIDLVKRLVRVRGEEVHLTPIEYKLLVDAREARGHGHDAPPAARAGLGPRARAPDAVPARLHDAAPPQARAATPRARKFLVTEPGIGYRLKAEV